MIVSTAVLTWCFELHSVHFHFLGETVHCESSADHALNECNIKTMVLTVVFDVHGQF